MAVTGRSRGPEHSTYGGFGRPVEVRENSLVMGGSPVAVLSERDPADIDWARLGAGVVVESTGKRTVPGLVIGSIRNVVLSHGHGPVAVVPSVQP